MNMKPLFMAASIVIAMSTAARAEDAAPATPAAPPAAAEKQDKMPPQREERFEERKEKALQRISEHLAKMQEKKACVEAAATPEALKACFPNMGKRGEQRSEHMGHHRDGNEGKPESAQHPK